MYYAKRFPALLLLILLAAPGWAFELETHRRISREAYGRSALPDVFQHLGLDMQRPLNAGVFSGSRLPENWLVKGALDEDDTLSVALARYRHHFYDPVNDRGLSTSIASGERAPDWALEDRQTFFTQNFSYRDARDNFLAALTLSAQSDREAALAGTFESLGHVIHLVQDMASPPHTRNDLHAGFGLGPESLYERHLNQPQVLARLNFNGTPVRFNLPRHYWITGDGRGLAEFVNRNFVSEGTNFTARVDGATGGGYPNPALRLGADETTLDIQTQLNPGLIDRNGNLIEGSVMFFANNFSDPITGGALRNERMTTLSLFDRELERKQEPLVFTLNRYNVEAQAAFLVPRAVGYSAGLLDYFFRGRLKGVMTRVEGPSGAFFSPPYTVQFRLTNESTEEMEGTFGLYSEDLDGNVVKLKEWNPLTLAAGEGQDLSFSVPNGFAAVKQFMVVFQGRLGLEEGAVAGNLVGPPDLYEPWQSLTGNHPWYHSTENFNFGTNPNNGESTTEIAGGLLIKNNIRYVDNVNNPPSTYGRPRGSNTFLGPFFSDGNLVRTFQDVLPIPITSRTVVKLKLGDISINQKPPCRPSPPPSNKPRECAWQIVLLNFAGGRYLEYTLPDQGVDLGEQFSFYPINPDGVMTFRIHNDLTRLGLPLDNLVLTSINIEQQLQPYEDPDTGIPFSPDPIERRQHMEVGYIWISDLDTDFDTDGDGLTDVFEITYGFDPINPSDASADKDGDGLSNLAEQAAGTNPRIPDSDGDGITDGTEVGSGGDPLAIETIPPTVNITVPVTGTTVNTGQTITITATAQDNVGVAMVLFVVNDTTISVTSPPFTASFTIPAGVAQLTIDAVAIDVNGNVGVAAPVVIHLPPPTVTLLEPAAGATFREGQTITLRASAQGNAAVAFTELTVNGVRVGFAFAPFEAVTLFTIPFGVTQLTIGANAIDVNGSVGSAASIVIHILPNQPPTVAITSPAEGATVMEGRLLTLTAEASDDGQVVRVEWTLNGEGGFPFFTPPYENVVTVPIDVTSLTIQATAIDNSGRTSTATRTITVQPDPRPTVVITSPAEGETVIEGSQLTLIAQATDNVAVQLVFWSINGRAKPPIFFPPYQALTLVPIGATSLSLQATATDNLGHSTTATRTITVLPDPGTTVVGRVVDKNGQPFAGANVTVFGRFAAKSQGNGTFSIPGVTTVRSIVAVAAALAGATTLQGVSAPASPVREGITNVGDISMVAIELYPGLKTLVGDAPWSVAVADLNADGKLDLVTANSESNDVSVLLGNGDGTFQAQRRFAAGDFPTFVAVADLNRDGFPDVMTANYPDISILLGNGDGTFQAPQSFAVGDFPDSVAVIDVNGDGFPDIVTANNGSNDVSILLGNGDGTFQPQQRIAAGDFPFFVAVADLNGDGFLDLVTANDSTDVSVLLGNGDGTFQAPQNFAVGDFPYSVAVVDVNGDGFADIVTANGNPDDVSILLGNGDGTFQPPQRFGVGPFPQSVAVADLNGDGFPDLVTTNGFSNDVSVLLGNGDGTFQAEQGFAAGSFPASVKIADLNGDGFPDIVTANVFSDDVSILLGNGDGTFQDRPPPSHVYVQGTSSVTAGDVNGDRIPDVVTADGFVGSVSVLIGIGDGTFLGPRSYDVGSYPLSVVVADLNGDGLADIVTANVDSNDVSVLVSNGEEDGGASFQTQQRFAAGDFPSSVAVADLNRDGFPDLVTANGGSNDVSVLLGNGDGTFQPQQRFAAGDYPISVAVADVNGDGFPDLVTANFISNDVSVLLGNGDGTFQPQQRFAAGNYPISVAVADLNRDGFLDIVTANQSNDVSVLLGNGDGTFQPQQRFAAGDYPISVAVADLNADGFLDIVTANGESADVSVLLGNGDGTFQSAQAFAAGGQDPVSVTVVDLNGDGLLDFAVGNNSIPTYNGVSVLLHQ
jgi:hypothetical protein